MEQLKPVFKAAAWSSLGFSLLIVFALVVVSPMPIADLAGCLALVSVGGAVIGALVAFSLAGDPEHDH